MCDGSWTRSEAPVTYPGRVPARGLSFKLRLGVLVVRRLWGTSGDQETVGSEPKHRKSAAFDLIAG